MITSLIEISVAADRPDREEAGGSGSRGEAEHVMRCEPKLWSRGTLDPSFPFTPGRTEREPPASHLATGVVQLAQDHATNECGSFVEKGLNT